MAESERCGFCFQQDMVEPKKMPCGHVYCLECLELHTENPDGVDCAYKYCQGFCANGSLKELPDHTEAETVKPEQKTNDPSDLLCDCNGCEEEKAVKYCVDCGSKLCLLHHKFLVSFESPFDEKLSDADLMNSLRSVSTADVSKGGHNQNLKHHPAYFKEKHHIICISKYEASPESFPSPECEYHGGKLHLACEHCQKLLCSRCNLLDKTCKGEVRNHSLKELQKFRNELESDYKQLIDSATENLTNICKEEKKTWTYHDEIQDKYDEMIKEVEERTQQQIRDLQQQADKVKAEINDEKEKITQKTVEKLSDLVMKREELEVYRLDATRLLEDAHISEKMRQRETIREKIETVTSRELGIRGIWCDKAAVHHTDQNELRVSLIDVPESLEFLSTMSTESDCYTVQYHHDTGVLLLGCDDGLLQLSRDGVLSNISSELSCVATVEHKGNVYLSYSSFNEGSEFSNDEDERTSDIILSESSKVCVCEYDIDSREMKMIFSCDDNSEFGYFTAVSDDYVALLFDAPMIKLYDGNADSLTTVIVPELTDIRDFKFLSDGSLLVLGEDKTIDIAVLFMEDDDGKENQAADEDQYVEVCTNQKLSKFRFDDNSKLIELWSCDIYSSTLGIAEGEGGLIYVARNQGTISVLSPSGVFLRVIRHDKLSKDIWDISIRGNELAVAENTNNVILFKIK